MAGENIKNMPEHRSYAGFGGLLWIYIQKYNLLTQSGVDFYLKLLEGSSARITNIIFKIVVTPYTPPIFGFEWT